MHRKEEKSTPDDECVFLIDRLFFLAAKEGSTLRATVAEISQERIEIAQIDIFDPAEGEHE